MKTKLKFQLFSFLAFQLFALTLFAQPATTPVQFNTFGFTGAAQNKPILLVPVNQWLSDGTNIFQAGSVLIQPTNGIGLANLIPNAYDIQIQGVPSTRRIYVPLTNTTQNAVNLTTNLGFFVYSNTVGPYTAFVNAAVAAGVAGKLNIAGDTATNFSLKGTFTYADQGKSLISCNPMYGTLTFPWGFSAASGLFQSGVEASTLQVDSDGSIFGNLWLSGTNVGSALTNLTAKMPQGYGVDSRQTNVSFAPPNWTPTYTRYVDKTGQDGTGGHDGTTLPKAWLTIAYAATTAAEGTQILINDGTYSEGASGNSWKPVLTYTTTKEFKAINPGMVTIQGNGDATYNLLQQNTWSNVRFTGLTFVNNGTSTYVIDFYNNTTTNVIFNNCTFHGNSSAQWVVNFEGSAANLVVGVDFYNCTFIADNASGLAPLYGHPSASNYTLAIRNFNPTINAVGPDGVNFYCATAYPTKSMVYYQNGGNITVGSSGHGIEIGIDGTAGAAVTGIILNSVINSHGHGILFGAGSTNCYARNVTITNSNDNIVFKVCTNSLAEFCTILNPLTTGGNGILFKGANGCKANNNLVYVQTALTYGISNDDGASSTYKSQNSSAFNNWIVVNNATAKAVYWTASGDSSPTAFGRNQYQIITGTVGSVNGVTVLTHGDLLSAWSFTNEVSSLVQ